MLADQDVEPRVPGTDRPTWSDADERDIVATTTGTGPGSAAPTMSAGPASLADLSTLRRRLRAEVAGGLAPSCAADDDLERLLLTFEELSRTPCGTAVHPSRWR